jgi:hypothetical protein
LWSAGSSSGDARGRGMRAPSRPRVVDAAVVQRVEVDLRRMAAGYERLHFLVRSWQHNEYVASCLEKTVARGGGLVKTGGSARARLYAALSRADRGGADAELDRIRRAAVDFDELYRSARRCVDRIED